MLNHDHENGSTLANLNGDPTRSSSSSYTGHSTTANLEHDRLETYTVIMTELTLRDEKQDHVYKEDSLHKI